MGLTFTRSFFFGGLDRRIRMPCRMSSGYYPVSLILLRRSAIWACTFEELCFINSA